MTDDAIAGHYAQDGLLDAIRQGIAAMGKTVETITPEDLAPLDEFHVGGRAATEALLDRIAISAGQNLLDIGCGIGGAARLAAHRYGARVTGIDATATYVDAGNTLCGWLGMTDRVGLQHGSALDLPFDEMSFDAAWMLHVGMNIADKTALCRAVHRVLKPSAAFGIYDIMRTGDGDIPYPVPWSTVAETSAVAPAADYPAALETAGFEVIAERNRHDFALAFFEDTRAKAAAAGGPTPLTIQLLMGDSGPQKFRNMVGAIRAGTIAPVEIIARRG